MHFLGLNVESAVMKYDNLNLKINSQCKYELKEKYHLPYLSPAVEKTEQATTNKEDQNGNRKPDDVITPLKTGTSGFWVVKFAKILLTVVAGATELVLLTASS